MATFQRLPIRSGSSHIAVDYQLFNFQAWAPVAILLTTSGGSGTADLVIWNKALESSLFDSQLFTIAGVGLNKPCFARIEEEERVAWTVLPDRKLHLAWTNPDDGNMEWGLQLLIQIYPYDEASETFDA